MFKNYLHDKNIYALKIDIFFKDYMKFFSLSILCEYLLRRNVCCHIDIKHCIVSIFIESHKLDL